MATARIDDLLGTVGSIRLRHLACAIRQYAWTVGVINDPVGKTSIRRISPLRRRLDGLTTAGHQADHAKKQNTGPRT